jgi:hypothetical protein
MAGKSGDGFKRTLGEALHRRSRFHAVALGMSHAELIRRAVSNFMAPKRDANADAALDRIVEQYEQRQNDRAD